MLGSNRCCGSVLGRIWTRVVVKVRAVPLVKRAPPNPNPHATAPYARPPSFETPPNHHPNDVRTKVVARFTKTTKPTTTKHVTTRTGPLYHVCLATAGLTHDNGIPRHARKARHASKQTRLHVNAPIHDPFPQTTHSQPHCPSPLPHVTTVSSIHDLFRAHPNGLHRHRQTG